MIPIMKPRNYILAALSVLDPTRLRSRTVKPEKGKGRKRRPRRSNRAERAMGAFL